MNQPDNPLIDAALGREPAGQQVTQQTKDLPLISTVYDQQPDGSWATTIVVSGLRDEKMAIAAQEHIINSFCDGEISEGQIQ